MAFSAMVTLTFAQGVSEKFSMTTLMFMDEMKSEHPFAEKQVTRKSGKTAGDTPATRFSELRNRRIFASPTTISGTDYVSCFLHMKDVSSVAEVEALGVQVEETFPEVGFVTALVPVDKFEPLAEIDNVTRIKVAEQKRPLTDVAREKTNVDDILTQSADAISAGLSQVYDGTGVILGIIDTGIDFQHIAFKDKDGNSRIKRAYVYNGSSAQEYTSITSSAPTTDDTSEDHGTHTATTAGGSSVTVSGTTVTVTDDHANATYGGMAPGADLYLAGINGLSDTYLTNALKKMVTYAESQDKPLVVSNSWGSSWGPRTGTGEWADLVATYFGDSHPNRAILFAASNDAGHKNDDEGGGYFVKKSSASSSSPIGTIFRTDGYGGDYYVGLISCAWNASNSTKLNCKIHVLNSSGTILNSWTVTTNGTSSFSGLSTYYSGSMTVYIEQENSRYRLALYSENGIQSTSSGSYTLAIEVYPSSGSADINMWAGDWSFFTDNYTTSGHTWLDGTDDMCVSDEATIPNAISIGAYVSKKNWKAASGSTYTSSVYTLGDIAYFSSYATADQSPTGLAYPWISAPGARLAAGVNHYHTTSVDDYSYFGTDYNYDLVVNNSSYPYAMMEGTSMATPVAAGIVALWMQAAVESGQTLTVNDVKNVMEQTAINDTYTTTGSNASHFGKGKIDALAGIQYILAQADPMITATPNPVEFDVNSYATRTYTKTVNVKGLNLTAGITATLAGNAAFSIDKTSITQSESESGVDITITWSPTTAGTQTATITLASTGADNVVVNITGTAKAATPIIVADETLTFTTTPNTASQQTLTVMSEFLTQNITLTLNDANSVFSLSQSTIPLADAEYAEVTVTFNTDSEGTYTGSIVLSSTGAESVTVSLSATASESASDPNTTTFKRVTSTDDLESGMRYIIACGSQETAAGALSDQILSSESVTISNDIATIGSNVAVFILEGDQTNGWTFKNEDTNQYLYATAVKKLAYSSTENTWTLANGTNGVIMTYNNSSSYGTMLYNVSSPRFTTYTSSTSSTMIQANLYMEYSTGTATKQDVTMSFSPTTATATVGEAFTEPTLTTNPTGLTVTYSSSNTNAATVDASTGEVTLVAAGETTITATFAGNSNYNSGSASYTLTVNASSTPSTGGTQLLYESLSGYTSSDDGTSTIGTSNSNLDYGKWNSFTKIYAGGTSNAYAEGGCLKFGSGNGTGSMTTGDISLTGAATLTFYLKKYSNDTGKLNVTVTGATADVTQFTPSNTWTQCTVNLTNATGTVTITLATSSKRAYVDEIKLETVAASTTPTITADPTSLSFTANVNKTETKSIAVTATNLTTTPTLTLSQASPAVFSIPETTTLTGSLESMSGTVNVAFAPTATGIYTGTLTLSSEGADDVVISLSATATEPELIVDPSTVTIATTAGTPATGTFDILGDNLNGEVTLTLTDANNVFSLSTASVSKADAEAEATVTVTFNPSAVGTYNATVTVSSDGVADETVTLTGTAGKAGETITVSSFGLTTFYTDIPLQIPYETNDDLLGVYYASSYSETDKELRIKRIASTVPAYTGMIVQANSGTYEFPIATGSVPEITGNQLQGTLEDIPTSSISGTILTLQPGAGGNYIGFYRYTGTTLKANKAYVVIPDNPAKQLNAMSIVVEEENGETTAINRLNFTGETDGDAWYTLQGVRLNGAPTQRGVYIHDGKKTLVK